MKFLVILAVAIGCFLGLIESIQSFDLQSSGIFATILVAMFLVAQRGKRLFR